MEARFATALPSDRLLSLGRSPELLPGGRRPLQYRRTRILFTNNSPSSVEGCRRLSPMNPAGLERTSAPFDQLFISPCETPVVWVPARLERRGQLEFVEEKSDGMSTPGSTFRSVSTSVVDGCPAVSGPGCWGGARSRLSLAGMVVSFCPRALPLGPGLSAVSGVSVDESTMWVGRRVLLPSLPLRCELLPILFQNRPDGHEVGFDLQQQP